MVVAGVAEKTCFVLEVLAALAGPRDFKGVVHEAKTPERRECGFEEGIDVVDEIPDSSPRKEAGRMRTLNIHSLAKARRSRDIPGTRAIDIFVANAADSHEGPCVGKAVHQNNFEEVIFGSKFASHALFPSFFRLSVVVASNLLDARAVWTWSVKGRDEEAVITNPRSVVRKAKMWAEQVESKEVAIKKVESFKDFGEKSERLSKSRRR